jgi:Flp pilus assembly protein TadG
MTRAGPISRFCRPLRRFVRHCEGVSAIEFATVLPFMLLMYIGGVELADGLSIQFKVTETARTITDLVSQYPSIDSTTMSGLLGASSQVVAPYPATNMVMTVSEIQIPANSNQGSVSWSCSLNGTARLSGSTVTVPTNLQNPSSTIYLIFGEVTYPYAPQLGYVITGTINIYESAYFYPRLVNSVPLPQGC